MPDRREAYYARVAQHHGAPLWERLRHLLTPEPRVASRPHLWSYATLRPLVLEAAELISAEEAERRVLILENPGLPDTSCITETLYAGLQLIMPGETAPAHRHTPSALRLVIEGRGAYTAVDGEKAPMERGDFIITPAWAWHDHGNEGDDPVIWLDVLDLPMIRHFGAVFAEHYPDKRFPEGPPAHDSLYRYGCNMRPAGERRELGHSPIFCYPYARVREALDRLKGTGEPDPCHGLRMEYIDPTTGGPAMATVSTCAQLLTAGFRTQPYRSSEGAVFSVIDGHGHAKVRDGDRTATFAFEPGDVFAVPCWHPYTLQADDETVLFVASDRTVQQRLGVWRERRGAEAWPDEP